MKEEKLLELFNDMRTVIADVKNIEKNYEVGKESGISVDDSAYEEDQVEIQQKIAKIVNELNNVADNTDTLELGNGETIDLPNPALDKSKNGNLPEKP